MAMLIQEFDNLHLASHRNSFDPAWGASFWTIHVKLPHQCIMASSRDIIHRLISAACKARQQQILHNIQISI